jgi:hypothetical protein
VGSILRLRWALNEAGEYDEACRRCEVLVTFRSQARKDLIMQSLRYDKRDGGSHGRALTQHIDVFSLKAGDRLEPSDALRDISKFEELHTPVTVVFWRPSEESMTRHRNPLFADPEVTGVSLRSVTVDILHALYLGVLNKYCAIVLWFLLSSRLFGSHGTAEEHVQVATMIMKNKLMEFYTRYADAHPEKPLTRVSDLTPKMIGTRAEPRCKTKGAETFGMAAFLVDMLLKFMALLGDRGRRLHTAGASLLSIIRIWAASGHVMSRQSQHDHTAKQISKVTWAQEFAMF